MKKVHDDRQTLLQQARLLKHHVTQTPHRKVRDFQKDSNGYGPALLVPVDRDQKRGRGGETLPQLLQQLLSVSPQSSGVATEDVMDTGDVAVVRVLLDEYDAQDFQMFKLLRLSRPQAASKTTDLSMVFGHFLLQSADDPNQYDSVDDTESRVRFRDILRDERGELLIVPRADLEVTLRDGIIAFELAGDFEVDVHDALDAEQFRVRADDSDEDEAAPQADGDALRAHLLQEKDQKRIDFMATSLRRGERSRAPARTVYGDARLEFYQKNMDPRGRQDQALPSGVP